MKNALYYIDYPYKPSKIVEVNYGSYESFDKPLIVNCASCCNTHVQHTNENKSGRLDYYLLYLISGRFDVTTPQGQAIVVEDEMIIIPPRQYYEIKCTGNTIYFLCMHFTGSRAKEILDENGILLFPEKNSIHGNNHLQIRFKTLFEAFAKDDEFRQRELALLAERLLIEAGRAKKIYVENNHVLSKSIRYINSNYTDQIKIPELAKMETMCLTAYNKRFKEQIGKSPIKYIIDLRMRMATELLETSSLSIKEISNMCGYSNFNFFTRVFKRYTGIPPTEYRKQI